MPTVVISTLCEDGSTTLGPYSLVQPYYVAGKDYYAMLLCCRNSSNTAQNILRSGKCAINFVDDNPKTFKECVKLSWPGDKPEEKMPKSNFRLETSQIEEDTGEQRPRVVSDAIQVIECTWMRHLDNAQDDQPGQLNGYEPPYHDFNGAAVMLFGLCFESAADLQKNKAKKVNPRRFVDTGLYRIVRCPNYLGEMTFWTGVLLSGIGAVTGWQWLLALISYIGIIFVMFSGARRLELRQNKNYGSDPEYRKYVKTVPILLPFVPLYSVEKYKWLVA